MIHACMHTYIHPYMPLLRYLSRYSSSSSWRLPNTEQTITPAVLHYAHAADAGDQSPPAALAPIQELSDAAIPAAVTDYSQSGGFDASAPCADDDTDWEAQFHNDLVNDPQYSAFWSSMTRNNSEALSHHFIMCCM